jgi:oligogalacturonide lyase
MKFKIILSSWSVIACLLLANAILAQVGKRMPSEKMTYRDSTTGQTITVLTTDKGSDSKIYQTHPQWTSDGQYIIFRSSRTADKRGQAYAVHEATGEIIQLTDGRVSTGSLNVARLSNKLYYFRNQYMVELNLDPLFRDSKAGKKIDSVKYERRIAVLPEGHRESGGFTMDADEQHAYIGLTWKEDTVARWCISSINIANGNIKKIIDIPFRVGHMQANPWIKGEILYCYETGGDATQRMWLVNADGSGNRPLYIETPDEWVTHEIWQDKDHVLFNLMGHLPKLRTKPQGLVLVNTRNNEVRSYRNAEGRGYWHCAAAEDGSFAAADTFTGELHQVNLKTGEIKKLTTGHYPITDGIPNVHSHHTVSPDGKRILFNSGKFGNLDLMIVYFQ